eukprot:3719277-Pyramimonas_sp.AAC.1
MRQPPPSTALAHCASPSQCSASWPHRELHRRSQRGRPQREPPPSTARASCVPLTQYSASWPHQEVHGGP